MNRQSVVRKPIKCPCCSVVTAVPIDGRMYLTDAAAGFYPSGYRCKAHGVPAVKPQPLDAPRRVTPELWARFLAEQELSLALKAAS